MTEPSFMYEDFAKIPGTEQYILKLDDEELRTRSASLLHNLLNDLVNSYQEVAKNQRITGAHPHTNQVNEEAIKTLIELRDLIPRQGGRVVISSDEYSAAHTQWHKELREYYDGVAEEKWPSRQSKDKDLDD